MASPYTKFDESIYRASIASRGKNYLRILYASHGHTMRKQGSCLEKEIMQGTMTGARRRGRPRTAWVDNIKTWTGLSVEESIRMTEDRNKWRKYAHGVANPWIEDGQRTEQNCMCVFQSSGYTLGRAPSAQASNYYFASAAVAVASSHMTASSPASWNRFSSPAVNFYRAMLCIRGTSRRPVSVRVRPCPSQSGVLLKRLNVGSHKQHHTIVQGL